jgi:ABC-2 type transport system permease protein
MLRDIRTVVWKEWKEWLLPQDKFRTALFRQLLLLGVLGVLLPGQMGADWIFSAAPLIYSAWVPTFIVATLIADSFAGERERHTLETMLASRLPDDAILFGKVAAVAGYGWIVTLLVAALGWLTVNLVTDAPELLLYPPETAVGIAGLGLLGAGLATGVGILVSLRAPTVRHAQQTLSTAVLVLFVVPVFGWQLLPLAWRERIAQHGSAIDPEALLPAVVATLLLIDVVLLALARFRFRRARLILD